MDLTDRDGPYNEVQTGPLRTQAEVGRLDPSEAVAWQEWWWPVRGIGGFTFANREVAANAALEAGELRLRLIGSGNWSAAQVRAFHQGKLVGAAETQVSVRGPAEVRLRLPTEARPVEVELLARGQVLARFTAPLELPVRQPPARREPPQTPAELAQAGWQNYLFANFPAAEKQFNQALEKDPRCNWIAIPPPRCARPTRPSSWTPTTGWPDWLPLLATCAKASKPPPSNKLGRPPWTR
jgi:hypothetical protein